MNDAWLPGEKPSKIWSGQVSGYDKVSDLFVVNTRSWNVDLLRSMFSGVELSQILSIPLSTHGMQDCWR